jgi:hypothetical protein
VSAALKRIRAACARRAEGYCECQCGRWIGEAGELAHADHAFGRGAGRPAESVETVWLLTPEHDADKTNNRPSAAYWLEKFAAHCDLHGYVESAELARSRLAFVETRTALVTR